MPTLDRLEELVAQNAVTGIDFVYVHPSQTTLDVFFLRPPGGLSTPLVNDVLKTAIRIYSPSGGEAHLEVPVAAVAWTVADGRDVLRITTAFPGDFSRYRLFIDDDRIDPYFNDVFFSFKANCPTELDCKPAPHECPVEAAVDFPVDYLARDFWSFRRALLDFASERYPRWKDRLEADAGVMLAEAMSALGDEFAYIQDRTAREAYLETAAERRSLRRHARLVDYEIHDGLGAATWLDFTIDPAVGTGVIPAGAKVWEPGTAPAGAAANARLEASRAIYEVGRGMADEGKTFAVDARINRLEAHLWDEDDTCLPVGSTVLYIKGKHTAHLPFDVPKLDGKWVLLKTTQANPAIPERAWMVRLIKVTDDVDPVFGTDITRLEWQEAQATPFELDLTALVVRGNLVPATAGETTTAIFMIGPQTAATDPEEAVERAGPNGTVAYLYSLKGSDDSPVVWFGDSPEIRLSEGHLVGATFVAQRRWDFAPSLMVVDSSQPGETRFTLDDGMWRRVVGYRRIGREIVHRDHTSGSGTTVRFGDGEFARTPSPTTIFEVKYRLSHAPSANLPAGSLVDFDPTKLPLVQAVTNPIQAMPRPWAPGALPTYGVSPETPEEIRERAPDAFRAITFRAVQPEDYARAAEGLPWVQRAGAALRWTGSWLTMFVTPDPRGAFRVTPDQRGELTARLDLYRQAGREAHGLDPVYANLDVLITVCVAPDAYRGEVKARVLQALFGKSGVRAREGFFSPDRFTFGTPLRRAALESAIQAVEGVRAVGAIRLRRRGWFPWRPLSELVFSVAPDEVIRVENDARFPERGSVRLRMEGGS
jgi:hypothetical protein